MEASRLRVWSERASHFEERETSAGDASDDGDPVQKRDTGTRLVRQIDYPKDFLVLAWAHGVTTFVDDVDYIVEETKGENTWVYVIDSGVNDEHWVSFSPFPTFKLEQATNYLTIGVPR